MALSGCPANAPVTDTWHSPWLSPFPLLMDQKGLVTCQRSHSHDSSLREDLQCKALLVASFSSNEQLLSSPTSPQGHAEVSLSPGSLLISSSNYILILSRTFQAGQDSFLPWTPSAMSPNISSNTFQMETSFAPSLCMSPLHTDRHTVSPTLPV